MDRREFVAVAALSPAAVAAALRSLSIEEAKWVEAIMAQIIPTDDAPGAKEAGCIYYLDQQLSTALSRFLPAYRKGIADFQSKHPAFLTLPAAEQTKTLERWNGNAFFEMLIDHTMQGFYGSPSHGGNQGEASWKMLGIDKYMGEGHWHGAK